MNTDAYKTCVSFQVKANWDARIGRDKAFVWCMNHFGPHGSTWEMSTALGITHVSVKFFFMHDEDAVQFKLVWQDIFNE